MTRGLRTASCEERRLLAALLVGLSACQGDRAGEATVECSFGAPAGYSVTDSTGVRVVESRCPQLNFGWQLGTLPSVDIGGPDVESAAQFRLAELTWATRLSDGRIVVQERASEELRYFSPRGEHLLTVGGKGDGPGEFQTMIPPALHRGDSLMVLDGLLRRRTLFDPVGQFVSVAGLEAFGISGEPVALAWLSDGSLLIRTSVSPSSLHREEGAYPWIWTVWRSPPDGGPPIRAFDFAGQLEFATYAYGLFALTVPFSEDPYVGWWEDGVVVGDRSEYVFRKYDVNGSLTLIARREFDARPVTDREMTDRRDRFLEQMRQGYFDEHIPAVVRMFDGPDVPRTHPAFDPVVVDRLGNLWVGRNQAEEGENHTWRRPGHSDLWSVFAPDGVWITDVHMPEGLRVSDIGDDYVLGVWEDELGVPYVREYELSKN